MSSDSAHSLMHHRPSTGPCTNPHPQRPLHSSVATGNERNEPGVPELALHQRYVLQDTSVVTFRQEEVHTHRRSIVAKSKFKYNIKSTLKNATRKKENHAAVRGCGRIIKTNKQKQENKSRMYTPRPQLDVLKQLTTDWLRIQTSFKTSINSFSCSLSNNDRSQTVHLVLLYRSYFRPGGWRQVVESHLSCATA